MRHLAALVLLASLAAATTARTAGDPPALVLEDKIPLGNVSGRIDHMAFDREHQLLFVAELGNNSVGVVDVKAKKVVHRLTGLREPQGVGYHRGTRTLYVADAGDGSVHLYQAPDFSPAGTIALGDDADNIRVDPQGGRVAVGYGSGGLAIIDPASRKKVRDIKLKVHPEGFQFDGTDKRLFVNLPDARTIGIVDLDQGVQVNTIDTVGARANFPMAIDTVLHRVLSVFRSPHKLMAFGVEDGKLTVATDTCGDSDDVFVDGPRNRVYVSCGEGLIDVFAVATNGYERIGRLPTVSGARTSLYVPTTDRLYLGVRASGREPAAIWVFKPQ